MTLLKPLSHIALATALAAPASAQCDCGDPMEFTTITQSFEFQVDWGPAPFPRQEMAVLPQFDLDAAAADNMTGPENVNLICAEVQFGAIIVPTGTLTNGSSSPCTASWDYDVQVALYANMEVAVPGAYFPSSNGGEEMLDGGSSAPLSMPTSASMSSYTETADFTNWIGTGELVWEGDGLAFESVSGCDPITADFANNVTISYSVLYTYCIPGEPPPPTGPGTPVCFGDGTGAACGCANNGAAGGGCANSTGDGAVLDGTGVASLSDDTLVLEATMTTNQPGVMFQGNVTIASPSAFGDGIRCCGQGVVRIITVAAEGNCASTDQPNGCGNQVGGVGGPISQHPGNDGLMAGDTRCYQWWYRDPGGGNPCQGDFFNLSNGYEVPWGV